MDTNLVKLSQIFLELDNYPCEERIKNILDSGFDVNYVVPANSQIKEPNETHPRFVGFTALHYSVKRSIDSRYALPILDSLLSHGADFTLKNKQGLTPLCLALEIMSKPYCYEDSKFSCIIDRLLLIHTETGNSNNPCSPFGVSHFHIACLANNVQVVKFFLESGVSANEAIHNNSKIFSGFSPLHFAMRNKHKDIAQVLLEYGADYNCLNADGKSPLHLLDDKYNNKLLSWFNKKVFDSASQKNNCILDLISIPSTNNYNPIISMGLTPLHIDCIKKYSESKLDDLEECWKQNSDLNKPTNLDSCFWSGYRPLHFAAFCNKQMAILLLKSGADIMAKDACGVTPLDLLLEQHTPGDLGCILKAKSEFESVCFKNGASLVEMLRVFNTLQSLRSYLKIFDANTTLPFDSPIWPGYSFLHLAVILSKDGDNQRVKICLKGGTDVTIKDANNMTALHLALWKNKENCLEEILNAHSNNLSNPVDDKNVSHFHIACINGHVKLVNQFLSNGVDPDTPLPPELRKFLATNNLRKHDVLNTGLTPLQNVASHFSGDSINLAKLLLEFKANPHLVDADGLTWTQRLFFANLPFKFLKFLWMQPKMLDSNPVAPGGLSNLHFASWAGTTEALKALIQVTDKINTPLTSELLKCVKNFPKDVKIGDTPLHLAVKKDLEMNVVMLLRHGADTEARNTDGLTPFQVSLIMDSYKLKVAKILANKFYKTKNLDVHGMTQLHVACHLRNIPKIKKSLQDKADVFNRINANSPIWPNCSPMDLLMKRYYYDTSTDVHSNAIDVLIDHVLKLMEKSQSAPKEFYALRKRQKKSSSMNNMDPKELVPLFHESCMRDNADTVEKFIIFGVDVNAADNYFTLYNRGYTALHCAVTHGNESIILMLLKHGADVSIESSKGDTPLHLAAKKYPNQLEIFLRTCKINFGIKNIFGETLMEKLMKNELANSKHFLSLLKNKTAMKIDFPMKMRLLYICINRFHGEDFKSLIDLIPNVSEKNLVGQNIFHNLALFNENFKVSTDCCCNMEVLLKNGCDLNARDDVGRTPLHLAVEKKNLKIVQAFVNMGVDINIKDNLGSTAFQYSSCNAILLELNEYICKIYDAGLHLRTSNIRRCQKYDTEDKYLERLEMLKEMQKLHITKSITLRSLLTPEMVNNFPMLPLMQRQAISEFIDSHECYKKFSSWIPVFKMQMRKALKRRKLFKLAVISLHNLLDARLPLHCIEVILIQLANIDLNNVVQALK